MQKALAHQSESCFTECMETPTTAVNEGEKVYYYRPCKYNNGATLKCAGFGAENKEHREFYVPYFNSPENCNQHHQLPGVIFIRGYAGDQITKEYGEKNAVSL